MRLGVVCALGLALLHFLWLTSRLAPAAASPRNAPLLIGPFCASAAILLGYFLARRFTSEPFALLTAVIIAAIGSTLQPLTPTRHPFLAPSVVQRQAEHQIPAGSVVIAERELAESLDAVGRWKIVEEDVVHQARESRTCVWPDLTASAPGRPIYWLVRSLDAVRTALPRGAAYRSVGEISPPLPSSRNALSAPLRVVQIDFPDTAFRKEGEVKIFP